MELNPEEKPHKPTLEIIRAFQKELMKLPQAEVETKHHFSNGIYAREMIVNADTVMVGKMHKTEHINVLSKGKLVVLTESGLEELSAPCIIVSPPGTKRIGYTLTDVIWTTFHSNPTDTQNLEELESFLIEKEAICIDKIREELECLG